MKRVVRTGRRTVRIAGGCAVSAAASPVGEPSSVRKAADGIGLSPATSLRRSGSVPYLAFERRCPRSCGGCPVADGVLSLTDALPQPVRVEAELRCHPAEREGRVVVGAEPGEGVVPIGLPGGGADGIEQRAFQYSGHQVPTGAVGRVSRRMLARKEDVRLEERRRGVASGV